MKTCIKRTRALWWVLSIVWIGLLHAQTDLANPSQWTPEARLQVKTVEDVRGSPNGRLVVYTVTEADLSKKNSPYRTHIYLTDSTGKDTERLTTGLSSNRHPRWAPDGLSIAFLSDRSGTDQIWALDLLTHNISQLTKMSQGVRNFQWAPDGEKIALTAEIPGADQASLSSASIHTPYVVKSTPLSIGLWIMSIDSRQDRASPVRLTPDSMSVDHTEASGYDWSPDGNAIVFSYTPSAHPEAWKQSDIAAIDLTDFAIETLVESDAAEHQPLYSPDGQTLAYLRSEIPPHWDGMREFGVYTFADGQQQVLPPAADRFGRHSNLIGWLNEETINCTTVHTLRQKYTQYLPQSL